MEFCADAANSGKRGRLKEAADNFEDRSYLTALREKLWVGTRRWVNRRQWRCLRQLGRFDGADVLQERAGFVKGPQARLARLCNRGGALRVNNGRLCEIQWELLHRVFLYELSRGVIRRLAA